MFSYAPIAFGGDMHNETKGEVFTGGDTANLGDVALIPGCACENVEYCTVPLSEGWENCLDG